MGPHLTLKYGRSRKEDSVHYRPLQLHFMAFVAWKIGQQFIQFIAWSILSSEC